MSHFQSRANEETVEESILERRMKPMQSSRLSVDENRIAQAVIEAIVPVIEDKMDTRFAAFEDKMDTRFAVFEDKMDKRFVDHMTELEGYYSNHYSELLTEVRNLREDYQKVFGKSE